MNLQVGQTYTFVRYGRALVTDVRPDMVVIVQEVQCRELFLYPRQLVVVEEQMSTVLRFRQAPVMDLPLSHFVDALNNAASGFSLKAIAGSQHTERAQETYHLWCGEELPEAGLKTQADATKGGIEWRLRYPHLEVGQPPFAVEVGGMNDWTKYPEPTALINTHSPKWAVMCYTDMVEKLVRAGLRA